MISFKKILSQSFVIIEVECGSIQPNILKNIKPPDSVLEKFSNKGVILRCGENSMPIWLWCYLVHFYHPAKFVAVFDTRSLKAVVVQDHSGLYAKGDLIEI